MATRYFAANINLGGLELQNARIHLLASDPGSPTEGLIWYNSTTHKLKYYDGTSVIDVTDAATVGGHSAAYLLDRANHTGTQLASTISNFDATVRSSRLDQMAAPTADVSLNSHKLTSVTDPTSNQDAATKAYVDSVAAGMRDPKDAARAATTVAGGNITLSGTQTIDGVAVVAGDRVLVKNQTSASQNGIYVVASGSWARSTDADASAEVTQGMWLAVVEGTVNAGTIWLLSTADPITLSTTALTFIQVGAGGTTYTGGTGITVTGSVIAQDTAYGRYNADIGDGSSTSITVTHSLGSKDVSVTVYDKTTPFSEIYPEVQHTSTSAVTLLFGTAPTSNQYRVVVKL